MEVPELKLTGNVKQNKVNVNGSLKGNSYLQWTIPGLHLELGRNSADVKGELGLKTSTSTRRLMPQAWITRCRD